MLSPPQKASTYSIRTILFFMVILTILPMLAFSVLLLFRFKESERERAERGLIESAKGIARTIDAQFITAEAALLTFKSISSLDENRLVDFEARLRRAARESGRDFVLLKPDGQQLINTFLPPGAPPPRNNPTLWEPVFKNRQTMVTNVFEGQSTKQLMVGVGIPIERDGEVKWALASGLFAREFAKIVKEPGVPNSWIVSIVDRNGRHIVRSHNNEEFAGKPLVPALIEHMKKGGTGTLRTTSLEGLDLISTVQFAPKSQWAAAVGLPAAELEAPMWASIRSLVAIGAVLTGATLLLGWLITRYFNGEILRLSETATRLGRGERVDSPGSIIAEANVIGNVLARASDELQALKTNLETQVIKRTAELTESNANLKNEIQLRRESEAQVLQMQKLEAVGQLTGGIAHDFNNMLAIILGSLRLIERRIKRGDFDVTKFIDSAVQGAERAASLTRRLLTFSRRQTLTPEVVDSNKLIAEMDELLRRTIPENIEIETVLAGGLWRSYVDVRALENVIINLAVNARDAMSEGGKLTIETANVYLDEAYAASRPDVKQGQYVMIAIADTGVGMTSDVISRAFDPFFTTKPPGLGTGLGLSQVHGFIKQSGGHVAIYSEPGQGATIKMYLPRQIAGVDVPEGPKPKVEPVRRAQIRKTVLVVEDEIEVRRLAVEMLQELGYLTLEAVNAADALDQLKAHPEVDLLFTDVVMPDMNGRMLAKEALRLQPNLAVLFTTGYTRNAIVHHGILDPGVSVIPKPYSLEALELKLNEVLYPDVTVKQIV